ncbi:winged helix-turn-helix domain-containing protein [Lacrimispora sp. 38-1]|uniref:winged helix-turn-helix domain-containing protein n=1 Tax=Lacrimispora sp. 38-1 TaxID=3125778 RepID=UPI003CED785A
MEMISFTKRQACRFLFRKQGLLGDYRFEGKQGVMDFIRQAGCIQFDPVDVCGKNAELVLQSRIRRFSKQMLSDLLYQDRVLVDYFDKNLSIFPVGDWPYFERFRKQHRQWERSHEAVHGAQGQVKRYIADHGPVCSGDLDMPDKVDWYWSRTKLSRAVLEHMYFTGELAVHHKAGSIKYYDLIETCIPETILSSPDPYPDEHDHHTWRILRRIGAVGLMWNRASDAWLNIDGLKSAERSAVFTRLLKEEKIKKVQIKGIKEELYMLVEDIPLARQCEDHISWKKRCEFIAPLDNLLWDRKLIQALFGFDYKWEIYTPPEKRRYGHYVLPVIYGDRFIGRIEASADTKKQTLLVKNIWFEPGVKRSKSMDEAIDAAIRRFSIFNQCREIIMEESYKNGEI